MSDSSIQGSSSPSAHTVHPREMVVFYRSCGHYSPVGRCWHLQVRGSIFAAASGRFRHRALLHLFKRVVKPEKKFETRQRFMDRAHLFLQDTRKGKSVPIAIAERAFMLSDSLPNGHFETTITLQEAELEAAIQTDGFGRRFVQFCAHLPEDDQRLFAGEIELISPEGISVISDVDDTIKVTNVADRKELLANTFTREFRSVEGMRELYESWAGEGVSFHYVSASPWPLYGPLVDWLDADGFPVGSMHLRHIRLRDLRGGRERQTSFRTKRLAIEQLLRTYPQRRFILCGDSGERDAELYSQISRDFGSQILHVAIRQCAPHPTAKVPVEDVAAHLSSMPCGRWSLFCDPQELSTLRLNGSADT